MFNIIVIIGALNIIHALKKSYFKSFQTSTCSFKLCMVLNNLIKILYVDILIVLMWDLNKACSPILCCVFPKYTVPVVHVIIFQKYLCSILIMRPN